MAQSRDHTTQLVRLALDGDEDGLGALVARLQGILISQARYRLGPGGCRFVDPEDVVAEVWLVALDRMQEFDRTAPYLTPRLLEFLTSTLRFVANNHLRRTLRRRARGDADDEGDPQTPADPRTGLVTRVLRQERHDEVLTAIEALTEEQRAVFVLRGVEGFNNREAARRLGIDANTCSHRWQRATERLRKTLGPSIIDELEATHEGG